jgi:hypothetical protein
MGPCRLRRASTGGKRRAVACLLVAVTGVWDLLDRAKDLLVAAIGRPPQLERRRRQRVTRNWVAPGGRAGLRCRLTYWCLRAPLGSLRPWFAVPGPRRAQGTSQEGRTRVKSTRPLLGASRANSSRMPRHGPGKAAGATAAPQDPAAPCPRPRNERGSASRGTTLPTAARDYKATRTTAAGSHGTGDDEARINGRPATARILRCAALARPLLEISLGTECRKA